MPIQKDPLFVNSFAHVLNKGPRGGTIVFDVSEKWRFLKLLYYLNDTYQSTEWENDLFRYNVPFLGRPSSWPSREPLVSILAYCLKDNHFHLLIKEVREGGFSIFIQRLINSMTEHYHKKHDEDGPLFRSTHKRKRIDTERYLSYLAVYIMVKNVFEMYPGGLRKAIENFEDAWQWALEYPFSSLPDYANERQSPIITKDILGATFPSPEQFKEFARSMMAWKGEQLALEDQLGKIAFE